MSKCWQTSKFDIPCSIFNIPLNFKIQNSLFNIQQSLLKFSIRPIAPRSIHRQIPNFLTRFQTRFAIHAVVNATVQTR